MISHLLNMVTYSALVRTYQVVAGLHFIPINVDQPWIFKNGNINTQTIFDFCIQETCDNGLEGCAHTEAFGPLVSACLDPLIDLVFVIAKERLKEMRKLVSW